MNIKEILSNKSNQKVAIAVAVFAVIIATCLFGLTRKKIPEVKKELFEIEVNTELSKKASDYMDNVNDESAEIDFEKVDVKKLGKYEGTIKYDGESYTIYFEIKDTKGPTIKSKKEKFVFALDTVIDEVNKGINDFINIEDNYDNQFDKLEIVKEIPSEEVEYDVKVSVKDSSGNESNELTLSIQFTESGIEKDGLEKKTLEIEAASVHADTEPTKETETDKTNTNEEQPGETTSGDDNDGNNGGNTEKPSNDEKPASKPDEEKPAPTPEPTPTPEPEPTPVPTPEPEPVMPPYEVPAGSVEIGVCSPEDRNEVYASALAQTKDPNSPYYGWLAIASSLSNGYWVVYLQPQG